MALLGDELYSFLGKLWYYHPLPFPTFTTETPCFKVLFVVTVVLGQLATVKNACHF